jgi:hypothetical protein
MSQTYYKQHNAISDNLCHSQDLRSYIDTVGVNAVKDMITSAHLLYLTNHESLKILLEILGDKAKTMITENHIGNYVWLPKCMSLILNALGEDAKQKITKGNIGTVVHNPETLSMLLNILGKDAKDMIVQEDLCRAAHNSKSLAMLCEALGDKLQKMDIHYFLNRYSYNTVGLTNFNEHLEVLLDEIEKHTTVTISSEYMKDYVFSPNALEIIKRFLPANIQHADEQKPAYVAENQEEHIVDVSGETTQNTDE